MTERPQPLTPADCNLRDFQFMPVDVARVLTSETWVLGSGDERAAAITLWLESWRQVPAGSVPNDDRMLAHLSQSKSWKKVRAHALRGWIEASDGRLYHPVVAEKVLEAWIEKLAFSISGSAGNAKRWGVEIETSGIRDRVIAACNMLRALAPRSKTLKKKAVVLIEAGSPPDQNTLSDGDLKSSPPDSPPDSPRDDRKLSPPDRKGQGQGQGQGLLTSKAIIGSTVPDQRPGAENDRETTPSGRNEQIASLLRAQGVQVTAQHPLVAITLTADPRITDDVLNVAIARAKDAKPGEQIPVKYVLRTVETVLAELAKAPSHIAAPQRGEPGHWSQSARGIEAMGASLGMSQGAAELMRDYGARVQLEINQRKGRPA